MKNNRQFFLKSVIAFIVAIAGAVLLQYYAQPTTSRRFFIIIPFIAFIINIAGYYLVTGKIAGKNFSALISLLFVIKFFSYMLLAIIYFMLEKINQQRLIFISFIFILYILNTVILLTEVMKYFKSISKNNGISK